MSGQSISCVIFDCDGVLIDSEIISARILIEQLASVGVDVDFAYVQQNFLGRSWVRIVEEMRRTYGLDLGQEFENGYRTKLLSAFETQLRAMDGVRSVIEKLSVPVCVATSSSPRRAARSLDIVGLADLFNGRVYTASQVQNGKPAPDLFLFAAEKMGVAPANCLIVEDSLPGVEAAKSAGCMVVRYMGGSHLDGMMNASQNALPHVTHFDKWDDFFSIVPDLN